MKLQPQSVLFAAENVPHFINPSTKSRVIAAYRCLHRNLNAIADPLGRRYLKQLAQHSFARFKYVTHTSQINGLLQYAETHELLWASNAANGHAKDLLRVLKLAYTNYGVKETPLTNILYTCPEVCNHCSLAYKLNNITMPSARTLDDHRAAERAAKTSAVPAIACPYWQLFKILKDNRVTAGKQKRKLLFRLEDTATPLHTVLGKPIAARRQANILRRFYSKFLKDSPRPVHPEIYDHITQELRAKRLDRRYRRSLQALSLTLYTVDDSGHMKTGT